MLTRLRSDEQGLGLMELLIAMVVLNVGMLATIAAFNSGALALKRASQLSTAGALAEAQMERYRAIRYGEIGLEAGAAEAADANAVYSGDPARDLAETLTVAPCPGYAGGEPTECNPSRVAVGPDGKPYRIDVYIFEEVPVDGVARAVKIVTVVVRDGANTSKTFVRTQSTFDQSTGS